MKNSSLLIIMITLIFCEDIQIINGYEYTQPERFSFLTSFPKDIKEYGKQSFRMDKMNEWIAIVGLTGLMIAYDEPLIIEAKKIGTKLNLDNKDNTTEFFSIFDQPIRFPIDLSSSFYFIGDGILHLGIASGFYTYGKFSYNNRAIQTGSQIAQAMASTGFLTQVIKHITGRVSPFRSEDGHTDRWTPFPNQIEYHKHVSSYDAFPSGHMAVCMATVTVIAENYSEVKWIRPVGYSAMTLLGFQMMNNGVHWMSDYPLSIAMGYYLGKIAVDNGRKKNADESKSRFSIQPMFNINLTSGISFNYTF